jgi:imidazolonepropionase-like amidohydrolase
MATVNAAIGGTGRKVAILGGQLFDGTGADPVKDGVVIVEGDRIAAVGTLADKLHETADVTHDLRPCTLLPGLIDAHVHLWGRSPGDVMPWATGPIEYRALRALGEANDLLAAGFTAVRDVGSQATVSIKKAIDEGIVPGPRMVASGIAIARTRGPWFQIAEDWRWVRPADGIDECRKAVHTCLLEGSSLIKLGTSAGHDHAWGEIPTYSIGEIEAMVEEAHAWGVRVATHSMGDEAVRRAVAAGVDTVEHGYDASPDTINLMAEKGTYLVPTLRVSYESDDEFFKEVYGRQIKTLKLAYEGGVKLVMGTDSNGLWTTHGRGNAIEFKLLGEVMEPRDALVAGMQTAAEAMGLDDVIGTLTPGKYADIVAAPEDPLKNLETLMDVVFVMQGGRVIAAPETATDRG